MLARYRYRVYPTAPQRAALARAFGCARVVFNDAIRLREEAHAAGEKVSDTEVQRRVVTLAKTTPEREWLGEVASVALVQACQDARRAYKNWFGSMAGRRKGRKSGRPQFKRKHGTAGRSAFVSFTAARLPRVSSWSSAVREFFVQRSARHWPRLRRAQIVLTRS